MKASKLISLTFVLILLATLTGAAGGAPLAGPCVPGAAYDPACDANQDGVITVNDIQLTAGHWNQTGTFLSDSNHTHLGQTWTGTNNLKIQGAFSLPDNAPLVLSNTSGDGLDIPSAIFSGVDIGSAHTGVHVGSAGSNGLYVESAQANGVYIYSANNNGVTVASAGNDGMYVDSAGEDGFVVCRVGNVSTCTLDNTNANGFEVANAEDYGARVVYAGRAAFRSDDSGTNGLYVATAGDSGVWIADATNWAGYFAGNINVTGNCTGCRIAQMAVNAGEATLQPGEIVAVGGIAGSPFAGTDMLFQVRRATPGSPLVGVVSGRAEPYTSQEDGSQTLVARHGQPAAAGEYLSVVIYGPMQVRAAGHINTGQRVTVDQADAVRAMGRVTVDGVTLDEGGSSLGVALETAGDGLVWVLVNVQ
jgi:hypothetical protein